MATTTNYSWTTPDDTDLVKDGAAAIRTLGSAIDTTVFNNAGAAVAKSTVDAKGDLIVGTADNTVGRLAVGTDGYTLVADSVETTGLKWVAPASGGAWTQAATGSLSGATVSITGLSGKKFAVFLKQYSHNSGSAAYLLNLLNNDSSSLYYPFTDPSPTSSMTPVGVTTFAAAATRNDGFYVDMADTSMAFKIIQGITPKNDFENGGFYESTSAITSIQLKMTSGSFDAGTYYVWSFA